MPLTQALFLSAPHVVLEREECICLCFPGGELRLPLAAKEVLQQIVADGGYTPSNHEHVSQHTIRVIVDRLLTAGFLGANDALKRS